MLSCVDAVAINNVFEQTFRPLITTDNCSIVTSKGILLTERMKLVKLQPYNFTGWIIQSIYTNDSIPCNGTLIHFNAVPLEQCLQDNSKSEGTYSFECSKGILTLLLISICLLTIFKGYAFRISYNSSTCNKSRVSDVAFVGNTDQCIPYKSQYFSNGAYSVVECTSDIRLPIPVKEQFMIQR